MTLASPTTVLLLAAVVYVIVLTAKSTTAALVLALGAWALTASTSNPFVTVQSSVLGIAVNALDIVSIAFLIVGIVRLLQGDVSDNVAFAILALVALVVVHIVRGAITDIGLAAAISSSRGWIYFVAGLAFGATSHGLSGRAFARVFIGFALALSVYAAAKLLVGPGLPGASNTVNVGGVLVTEKRPLNAAAALLVLLALIILIGTGRAGRGLGIPAALLLGAMVLLLQHRTVWAAAVGAFAVGYFAWARRALPKSERAVLASSGSLVLLTPFVVGGVAVMGVLRESLLSTWGLHSTFQWRTASWTTLLAEHHSPSELLYGRPAGASWEREVLGLTTDIGPHSLYVEGLLRFGFLLLVVLAAIAVVVFRGRETAGEALGLRPAAVVALLVALGLFGVAYSFTIFQGLLLGLLAGAAARPPAADSAEARAVKALPHPARAAPARAAAEDLRWN